MDKKNKKDEIISSYETKDDQLMIEKSKDEVLDSKKIEVSDAGKSEFIAALKKHNLSLLASISKKEKHIYCHFSKSLTKE